jgi:predicted transcriptional regulator
MPVANVLHQVLHQSKASLQSVAQFGRIASPNVRELIDAMSQKSNAEAEARASFDENRSYR